MINYYNNDNNNNNNNNNNKNKINVFSQIRKMGCF